MASTRRLDNWIDGFMKYTDGLPTSDLFREWTGIFIIGAALERKVYMRTLKNKKLFPNLQVFLIASPGIGKTVLTSTVIELFEHLPEHKRASSDVSKASLLDELAEAKRSVGVEGIDEEASFNSLLILSNELGALLPSYDPAFLNLITELYDGNPFSERRRHRKKDDQIKMERPQVNMLCATTPSQLKDLMPEGAWDQGFAARTFMIFESKPAFMELFANSAVDKKLNSAVIEDLKSIGELMGEIHIEPEALEAARAWHRGGGQPQPNHPRLEHYKTRRTSMHIIKLAMIASVAESDDLIITERHFKTAQRWMLAAEKRMPYIFKSMHAGGDRQVLLDVWYAARKEANQNGGLINNSRIFSLIQDRTSESWKVPHFLTNLVKLGVLIPAGGKKESPDYKVAKFKADGRPN